MYKVIETKLQGVLILEPQVYADDRGFFFESFNQREFEASTGIKTQFVQDNHSKSTHGVLRGLHFQDPNPQGKLVRVIAGEIFDVVVDLRSESSTRGQWLGIRLNSETKQLLWIPPGFAHGFLVLSEIAECLYKTTEYWNANTERSLLWNDTIINIDWPLSDLNKDSSKKYPILAKKDMHGLHLNEFLK